MTTPTAPTTPTTRRRLAALLPLLLGALACTTQPTATLPVPPAPVDLWAAAADGGSFLGLKTEENDSRSLDTLFFEPGVRVVHAVENSPAARAGLRAGDVVLSAGGHEVFDPEELDAVVDGLDAGDLVLLEVQRGDALFDIEVQLVAADGTLAAPQAPRALVDATYTRATWLTAPGGGGVGLGSLADDSPLLAAGLAPGQRVLALDGTPVLSARALLRRLSDHAPGDEVELLVADGGDERVVEVRLVRAPRMVTGFHIPILIEYENDPDGRKLKFEFIDLWILSLFRYERVEGERTWTFLSLFDFSTGVGSLGS